nr:MAG TPA: hypothetical protein [Podoviridae sp. ctgHy19]
MHLRKFFKLIHKILGLYFCKKMMYDVITIRVAPSI